MRRHAWQGTVRGHRAPHRGEGRVRAKGRHPAPAQGEGGHVLVGVLNLNSNPLSNAHQPLLADVWLPIITIRVNETLRSAPPQVLLQAMQAEQGPLASYISSVTVLLLRSLTRSGQQAMDAFLDARGVEDLVTLAHTLDDDRPLCLALCGCLRRLSWTSPDLMLIVSGCFVHTVGHTSSYHLFSYPSFI